MKPKVGIDGVVDGGPGMPGINFPNPPVYCEFCGLGPERISFDPLTKGREDILGVAADCCGHHAGKWFTRQEINRLRANPLERCYIIRRAGLDQTIDNPRRVKGLSFRRTRVS